MLKLFIALIFVLTTFNGPVYGGEIQDKIARLLYPANATDQAFTSKFFDIVELHKTQDPLFEGKGPSVTSYSLDTIKFAFMTNETEQTVDLVFFNWSLPQFNGMSEWPEMTRLYGHKVYILRGVEKKLIATQGENNDQLTNFSYVLGSKYMEAQAKNGDPDIEVPEEFLDWRPHPEAMDKNHPLRKTLGTNSLSLLSPSKDLFLKQCGMTDDTNAFFDGLGGIKNIIMGLMVHEMYHLKEGEDFANGLAAPRDVLEDRKTLVEQLKTDAVVRELYVAYAKIVFSIGDSLKNGAANPDELQKLKDLSVVISHLKANYHNAWSFIWGYEYIEGFAEYVSAYSMVQTNLMAFSEQIDLQKADTNNFAYRTGTIGGFYLANRLNEMPFDNNEDHRQSLWELILERVELPEVSPTLEQIKAKYSGYKFDAESEIELIIEYLVSTDSDM